MRRLHGSLNVSFSVKPVRGPKKTTSADFKHFRIPFLKVTTTLKISKLCLTGTMSARGGCQRALLRKKRVLPRTSGLWGNTFLLTSFWDCAFKGKQLSQYYQEPFTVTQPLQGNNVGTFGGWLSDINNVLAFISTIYSRLYILLIWLSILYQKKVTWGKKKKSTLNKTVI